MRGGLQHLLFNGPQQAGTAGSGAVGTCPDTFATGGWKESESEGAQEATVTVLAMFLLIIGAILILLGTLLVAIGVIVIFMGIVLIAIAAFLLIRRVLRHGQ